MPTFVPVTAEDYAACLQYPPSTIQTSAGAVEYAMRGEGPVLLTVHGGPGGYDQGLALGELFRKNGFSVLAMSRPGYLGTSLDTGASLEGQADALAAFLDALGLDKVAVCGASAGGPPSYLLAQRHPDRVVALLEIDSVSTDYAKAREINRTEEVLFLSKPGLWIMDFLTRHFPEAMVKALLQSESDLEGHELGERARHIVADPAKLAFVQLLARTMSHDWDRRKAGVHNDLDNMNGMPPLPLDKISCPTLLFHGTAEADVTMEHAEYAHQAIAGSELFWIEGGSHVGFWASDKALEAQGHAVAWLREKMGL